MFIVTFIAIFFSSIIGATIFGISLNKLALIPLELYLFLKFDWNAKFRVNKLQKKLILWYIIASFSSISGMLFSLHYNIRIIDEMISNAMLQIISYLLILLPIAVLLWNSKERSKHIDYFNRAILWTCRFQALWGIAQFVLLNTLHIDLNSLVLGSLFGGDWTAYSNLKDSAGGITLRVTGINHDAAFLGMLLVIGFILDRAVVFRFVYILCASLALSRSAIVGIATVVVYMMAISEKKIDRKSLYAGLKYTVIILILICLFLRIYINSPAIQIQLKRVLERFSTIATGQDGTGRHMGYPLVTMYLEMFKIPILQKLIGVGNQCGGILMSYYSDSISWLGLSSNMQSLNHIWTVESDFASIFLETGIVGGLMYYDFLLSSYRNACKRDKLKRALIFGLVIFGVMYNLAGAAFIQLVYIALYSTDYYIGEEQDSINAKHKSIK